MNKAGVTSDGWSSEKGAVQIRVADTSAEQTITLK